MTAHGFWPEGGPIVGRRAWILSGFFLAGDDTELMSMVYAWHPIQDEQEKPKKI